MRRKWAWLLVACVALASCGERLTPEEQQMIREYPEIKKERDRMRQENVERREKLLQEKERLQRMLEFYSEEFREK